VTFSHGLDSRQHVAWAMDPSSENTPENTEADNACRRAATTDDVPNVNLTHTHYFSCSDETFKVSSIRLRPRKMAQPILPISGRTSPSYNPPRAGILGLDEGFNTGLGMRSEIGLPMMLRRLTKFKSMVRCHVKHANDPRRS
jgi:hypothetical protein